MQVFCSVIFAPVVYFMVGFSPDGNGWRFFTFMLIGKYPGPENGDLRSAFAFFALRKESEGNAPGPFVYFGS